MVGQNPIPKLPTNFQASWKKILKFFFPKVTMFWSEEKQFLSFQKLPNVFCIIWKAAQCEGLTSGFN
jgi:hypothetical protein